MKTKTYKSKIELDANEIASLLSEVFGVDEDRVDLFLEKKSVGWGLDEGEIDVIKCRIEMEVTVPPKEPTITFNPTTRDSDVIRVPAPAGTPQNPYVPSPYYVDTSKEPLDFHSTTGADPRSSTVVTAKSTSDDFAGENFTWGD